MANLNAVPVGDASVMLHQRELGQIQYNAGRTEKLDIKVQPNLLKNIMLHCNMVLEIASSIGILELLDVPFNLMETIQVKTSNGLLLKNFTGQELAVLNRFDEVWPEQSFSGSNLAPPGNTKGRFHFDLKIPFDSPTLIQTMKERTILNSNEFSELTLYIQWAQPEVLCADPTSTAIVELSGECAVIPLERMPLGVIDESTPRQKLIELNDRKIIDSNHIFFDLPENTLIDSILLLIIDHKIIGVNGGFPQNARYCNVRAGEFNKDAPFFFDRIKISDNNQTHILREFSAEALASINVQESLIERENRVNGGHIRESLMTICGAYMIRFDKIKDFTSLFSTIGINNPRIDLYFNFANFDGDGTPYVQIVTRQIVTPAVLQR